MHNIDLIANDEFASAITQGRNVVSVRAVFHLLLKLHGIWSVRWDYRQEKDNRWSEASQQNLIPACLKYKTFLDGVSILNKFKINNFHWKSFKSAILKVLVLTLKTCFAGNMIWIRFTNVTKALRDKSGKEFRWITFLSLIEVGQVDTLTQLVLKHL